MFLGHFGAGMAGKKVAPRVSLGTLFLASQFIDLLWPLFLIFGIEKVKIDPGNTAVTPLDFIYYPFSHSLIAVLFWALMFGAVYFLLRKDFKAAVILGLLVTSHWILDLLTHRPDLPIYPGGSAFVGLGLWNSLAGTIVVEGAIFIAGVYLYISATKAKNKSGLYGFWALIFFLVIIYISNLFGPPPPSVEPLGYVGLAQWLLILWAYWIGRNREQKS